MKPCPACGKAAIVDELFDDQPEPYAFWVHCYEGFKECPERCEVVRPTEEAAIEAWNTRCE